MRAQELEAFREKLRSRTLELQLGATAARGRAGERQRELEVTVEDE